jgi:hypothetical protein
MTNAIKVLLQRQSGFLQLESTLSHNLIKSEFHVQTNYLFSSIKFEITMNLKQFSWVIQNDYE